MQPWFGSQIRMWTKWRFFVLMWIHQKGALKLEIRITKNPLTQTKLFMWKVSLGRQTATFQGPCRNLPLLCIPRSPAVLQNIRQRKRDLLPRVMLLRQLDLPNLSRSKRRQLQAALLLRQPIELAQVNCRRKKNYPHRDNCHHQTPRGLQGARFLIQTIELPQVKCWRKKKYPHRKKSHPKRLCNSQVICRRKKVLASKEVPSQKTSSFAGSMASSTNQRSYDTKSKKANSKKSSSAAGSVLSSSSQKNSREEADPSKDIT